MQLLPIGIIAIDQAKLERISSTMQDIYRLIIYSRHHLDDDLLDAYSDGMHSLQELVSIKNAQMEAQDEEEALRYLDNLNHTVDFVISEITEQQDFKTVIQLFQLLRLISPETSSAHPNQYRKSYVQVGAHICPDPALVQHLVAELLYRIDQISNPIIRAIYFHHELIRIHPFADGNGRVARIAKNWMLMHALYPPIYINDATEKQEYIHTLAKSFRHLEGQPEVWNIYTERFFDQELDRLLANSSMLYHKIVAVGNSRINQNTE